MLCILYFVKFANFYYYYYLFILYFVFFFLVGRSEESHLK